MASLPEFARRFARVSRHDLPFLDHPIRGIWLGNGLGRDHRAAMERVALHRDSKLSELQIGPIDGGLIAVLMRTADDCRVVLLELGEASLSQQQLVDLFGSAETVEALFNLRV